MSVDDSRAGGSLHCRALRACTRYVSTALQLNVHFTYFPGLTYHDAIAEGPAIQKAISRLPLDMQEARERRIRRAFDLSAKKMYLPKDQQQDPWREFEVVDAIMARTQMEYDEMKHLNDEAWSANFGFTKWYSYDTENTWFWQRDALAGKAY